MRAHTRAHESSAMFPMRATRESIPNHRAGTSLCSDLIDISTTILRPKKHTDGSGSNQRRSSISSQNRTGPGTNACAMPCSYSWYVHSTGGTFIQPDHLGVHETLWDGMTSWARFLNPTGMHSVSSSPTTVSSDSQILEILSMPLIGRPIFIRSTECLAGTFIQPDHLGGHETLWDGMTPGARFLNPTGMHSVSSSPTTVGSDSQILEILSMTLIELSIFLRSTEYLAGTFIQPDHLGGHETLWDGMTPGARFLNPTGDAFGIFESNHGQLGFTNP